MDSGRYLVVSFLICLISKSISGSTIETTPEYREFSIVDRNFEVRREDSLYCDSWRFSVETNDAGTWSQFPARCEGFMREYLSYDRYRSDSDIVAEDAVAFARTAVKVSGESEVVAWVFDIDETLLSNVPYYSARGFRSEPFDESTFDEWVDLAEAPALPASMRLYNELQQLGFKIFLLTGRVESQRNVTHKNLLLAGFRNWEKLILRGDTDIGKTATIYKSEKRKEIEDAGYTIYGSSGDQWSDLLGFAVAKRSFKLPNPIYYIP